MPRFTTAPVETVAPQRKVRGPSQRAIIHREYMDSLQPLVDDKDTGLIVELDDGEKALTVRNRIYRAARGLGIESIRVRRRGGVFRVWRLDAVDGEQIA